MPALLPALIITTLFFFGALFNLDKGCPTPVPETQGPYEATYHADQQGTIFRIEITPTATATSTFTDGVIVLKQPRVSFVEDIGYNQAVEDCLKLRE